MFDVVAADLKTSSTQENTRKPGLEDASQRARALLGSLKEKRDFFESRIHVANSTVHERGDQGNFPTVHCPSPTKSSFNFLDMTTKLGSKIQERQNMLNRLTCSPGGSFRTANTQETTESTLTASTSKESTVIVRIPPAPSLKDIEDSIKEDVRVVIPVRDHSPSPELSTSWLEDSSDTQQKIRQKLDTNIHHYPDVLPSSISTKDTYEKDQVSARQQIEKPRYTVLFPSSFPLQETTGLVDVPERITANKLPKEISSTNTAQSQMIDDIEPIVHELPATKPLSLDCERTPRSDGASKKKKEKMSFPGKENVSNGVKSSAAKGAKKEKLGSPNKPPRPSRRCSRSKRTIKDRRKTEMALSAASVLLEPASSFEDYSDTCSLKSADIPSSDYAAAGLRPPVVQEKDKIEKLAKHGLKVSPCGSQPTRYVKQPDPRPAKARRRSVSFALPDETNIHVKHSACSATVLPGKKSTKRSQKDGEDIHYISQKDAEMVPNVETHKGGISQNGAQDKSPVVLMQFSEDSQEDRSAFLKSVFNTHGPLSCLKSKKDVKRISFHVNRFGILRKRCSNTSDDSSMDFTTDSNTSGWMSSSESLEGAVCKADVEDLSDIDVVIEKRNPRVTSPLASPRTSKERVVYCAKLVSSPVPVKCDENECVPGGLLVPELDGRCPRKHKHGIPILLRPLVFASENQSDALSQCYGGIYSISSESIVENRIQAFERKIRAGQHVPQFQPISKEFPCATRGSLYDIAVHSGCIIDQEKLTPKAESKRKENPAKGGLYYLALSSGLSRSSIESRSSYTIFTKTSACSVIESNGEVVSERDSDERCGAFGSLYLAKATLSVETLYA